LVLCYDEYAEMRSGAITAILWIVFRFRVGFKWMGNVMWLFLPLLF